MKIVIDEEGNSGLLFEAEEKDLITRILLSLVVDDEETKANIQYAIRQLKYAGQEIPDNVYRIH